MRIGGNGNGNESLADSEVNEVIVMDTTLIESDSEDDETDSHINEG